VDAQVIEESGSVLGAMKPRLLEMNLGDEEAWEIGLTCGGTVEVFVEPVALDRPGDPTLAIYERARAHAEAGGRAAIVSRLDDAEHAKVLVLDDGRVEGSLGPGARERTLVEHAREAITRGRSATLDVEGGRVFIEVFAPPALLLCIGAGHVAMSLVALARLVGYRTVVIDGRPQFATPERFPEVDELKIGIPSELLRSYPLVPSTALVLVAHDYKYDIPVLRHALSAPLGYIGMLASTRRAKAIMDLLVEDGVPRESLGKIHVPIGLDLGAQTAPEIALAILAEIQATRAGRSGRPLHEIVRGRTAPA
jgi:xanthine dehydrogenase accessory factor